MTIARRIDQPKLDFEPECFAAKTMDALIALDAFRVGDVDGALAFLGREWPPALRVARDLTRYAEDRAGFKRALRRLARDLRKHGL